MGRRTALVVWLALLGGCVRGPVESTTVPTLIDYRAPDESFSIRLPATPEVAETGELPMINKVAGTTYLVDQGERSFLVQYTRFSNPRTDPAAELAGGRDNLLRAMGGSLLRETEMEVSGHPGKALVLKIEDDLVQRVLFFVTDFELYQIIAVVPAGEENSKLVNEVFDSFQLTPGEPASNLPAPTDDPS